VFEVGEIDVAIWRLEHSVGRGRLRYVLDFRFEIALRKVLVGQVTRFNPVERVAGERVIIEIVVLGIERDAVRRDLRRTFLLLIDQFFPVHDQLKSWFRFGRFMIVEQSSRFAAYKIDNDDCALGGVGDQRFLIGGVDADVIQITFRGRDIFTGMELSALPCFCRDRL
jgi:hypothetical protein